MCSRADRDTHAVCATSEAPAQVLARFCSLPRPDLPFTPIILLQCSRVESETRGIGQRQGWSYIQGAGDDEENWTTVAGIKGFAPCHLTDQVMKTALQLDHDEEIVEYLQEVMQEAAHAATTQGAVNNEDRLQLHRIPFGASIILATTTLPTHAAVDASLNGADLPSASPVSLSQLHLYFDSTAEVKHQRKAKLAAEAQRAMEKAMRRGEDDDDQDEDEDASSAMPIPAVAAAQSSVDLLDWPQEARLAVPVSVSDDTLPLARLCIGEANFAYLGVAVCFLPLCFSLLLRAAILSNPSCLCVSTSLSGNRAAAAR